MEKKFHRFSKAFLPCGIFSIIVILFGVFGMITKGVNFGIDFKAGLVEEVRIAPVNAEVTYSGNARATIELSKDRADVVISGTGAENETKTFLYSEYATVADVVTALNTVNGVSAVLKTDGTLPSSALFLNSAVSPQLSEKPFLLYAGASDVTIQQVRDALDNLTGISIKDLGSADNATFQIRMAATEEENGQELQDVVLNTLGSAFGEQNIAVAKVDFIGSSFSNSLAKKSIILFLATMVLIWVYAAFRFHWDFALGAVIALLHDVLIMFTFIVWTRMEFSTTVLAAVLTIVGYSINDTVVILDRVRSNISLVKVNSFNELLDRSLSDTLSRSIITTVTTLFAVVALYVFTSGSIKDFALALMVGLVSGCYSSLFISSGFISLFRKNWKQEYGVHHSLKTEKGVLQLNPGIQI